MSVSSKKQTLEKNLIRLIAFRKQNVSWYKPVTLNELNCSCFCHIINILLTDLSRSVWENLDLGLVYRPHWVWYDLGQDSLIQKELSTNLPRQTKFGASEKSLLQSEWRLNGLKIVPSFVTNFAFTTATMVSLSSVNSRASS